MWYYIFIYVGDMYKKLPIKTVNDKASKFVVACLETAYSYKNDNKLEYWLKTSDQYYKGYYPEQAEKALWRTFKTFVPHFNAYQVRVATIEDVFLDHRFNTQNKPFTINPTPLVNLPYSYREKIAEHVMNEFNLYHFIEQTATNPVARDMIKNMERKNPMKPMKPISSDDVNALSYSSGNATMLKNINPLSQDPRDLIMMNPGLNLIDNKGFKELVKLYADVGRVIMNNKAKKSAKKMEALMYDQMVQTNFKQKVFTKMIGYLARYPITVVKGASFIHNSSVNQISNQSPMYDPAFSLSLGFESINPYNIFFFDDAETLNNSSCVIDISYHTPSDFSPYLGKMKPNEYVKNGKLEIEHNGSSEQSAVSKLYQKERIAKAMEKMRASYSGTHGMSLHINTHSSQLKSSYMNRSYWSGTSVANSSSIPKINMTKKLMGWEIKQELYGAYASSSSPPRTTTQQNASSQKIITSPSSSKYEPSSSTYLSATHYDELHPDEKQAIDDIYDYDSYLVTMEVICDEVVLAYYRPYAPDSMGYYASSFRNEPDKIVGTGLCELIKPIQDQINDVLISMCRATQWESRGLTVVDEELIDYSSLNGDFQINPGQVIRAKYDAHGTTPQSNNRVPITRLNPNTTNHRNLYLTLKDLMRDADELTGIHGTLSGISRSSSENRVGSVYTTKVNFAMKPIQRMANGVDANIIEPMFKDLYQKNMKYHWDESLKGDASLMIEGATGMLSRNLKQENMMNTLQIVQQGVALQAFQPELLTNVLSEMLEVNGYDIDAEKIRTDIDSLPEAQDIINEQKRIEQTALQQQALLAQQYAQGGETTTNSPTSTAEMVANNPNLPPDVAQKMAGSFNGAQGQVGNRLTEDPNRVDNVQNQLGNTTNIPESNTIVPAVAPNVQTTDGDQLK